MPTDFIMIDIIARNTVYGILQKMQKKGKKIKRKQEKRLETSELGKDVDRGYKKDYINT